jgi:hypothetical protein
MTPPEQDSVIRAVTAFRVRQDCRVAVSARPGQDS